MTFGVQCGEQESFAILDRAAEGGVTFLDTSNSYPHGGGVELHGRTEEIIGRWLQGRRHDFVVATKCFGVMGPHPFHRGASRKHVFDAVEGSLRRLRTDHIDLYQLHHPDPETPIDETLEALDDLVRSGKVRYVGCSNFLAYQVARALGRSELRGLARFASVQPRYNLLFREVERELLPLCREEGVGVIAYNPLAGGMLTGKHDPGKQLPASGRFGPGEEVYRDRYWHAREFETVEALRTVAANSDLEMPTLAVAWVLANPAVTSAIVGASHPAQLEASLAAVDVKLDESTLAELDGLTRHFRLGDSPR
jgi:aryl-alcohol dehydrogenase (NADP+)